MSTFAGGLGTRPHFVTLTSPHRISNEHVAVVALIGDERVVRDRVVDGATVQRICRSLALDGYKHNNR